MVQARHRGHEPAEIAVERDHHLGRRHRIATLDACMPWALSPASPWRSRSPQHCLTSLVAWFAPSHNVDAEPVQTAARRGVVTVPYVHICIAIFVTGAAHKADQTMIGRLFALYARLKNFEHEEIKADRVVRAAQLLSRSPSRRCRSSPLPSITKRETPSTPASPKTPGLIICNYFRGQYTLSIYTKKNKIVYARRLIGDVLEEIL